MMYFTRFCEANELYAGEELDEIREAELVPDVKRALSVVCAGDENAVKAALTGNKFFNRDPFIGSPELNRRGLHVCRVVFSHYAARRYLDSNELLNGGLLIFDKFTGRPGKIAEEIRKVEVVRASKGEGNRITGKHTTEAFGEITSRVKGLFRERVEEAEQQLEANSFVQRVVNRPDDADRQKLLHCDTFFPALKWWYFPEKVRQGAFVYVPSSPMLAQGLLQFHYEQSIRASEGSVEAWRGKDHAEGSLRISDRELSALGLEAGEVEVEADTLVIANVFGFHRRGDTEKPHERVSLHGSIRLKRPF